MQYFTPPCQCVNCQVSIHATMLRKSVNYLGYALCQPCQDLLKSKLRHSSRETAKLYFSLKRRGVPAAFDEQEMIGVEIIDATLHIVVENPAPSYHPDKALAQLRQAFFDYSNGDPSFRIPNALVAYNLEETADQITQFLNTSSQQISYLQNRVIN